ncbi:hypothetical protein [Paenibacillus sp. MSJ-34]|uniref:hypothetical protein n=1 Tax=Paenibacillus sp. MSJ-34 TaxID=2841529 RepID=UPI001C0F45A1|nr:hypothetical protein [Paenibacillus sp. MSJ-34]MBU5441520.1 hypothetical protein [Paenibacillus sp. MSJ-34]
MEAAMKALLTLFQDRSFFETAASGRESLLRRVSLKSCLQILGQCADTGAVIRCKT